MIAEKHEFIKKPEKGNVVKVYGWKESLYGFGVVSRIETIEADERDENTGKHVKSKQIAILLPLIEAPVFNKIDFFLPEKKVIFSTKS